MNGESPVWMVYRRPLRCLDGSLRRWERFAPGDSAAIDVVHRSGTQEDVIVHSGRYTVNVHSRWMQAYYWKENRWPIVRGTWFWRESTEGVICPFGEADSETIEEAYSDILSGREEGPIDCDLVDTDIVAGTVQFVRELVPKPSEPAAIDSKSTESKPDSVTQPKVVITFALYRLCDQSNVSRTERLEVYRGYPSKWEPTSEEQLSGSVSHLVFAVHGIGEALYNRQNDPQMGSMRFRGNCDLVRENLNSKLLESVVASRADKSNPPGRVEVLPIEWSESIHSNFLDRRLESVTLPNLSGVRDFANLALTDVFLYTQTDIKTRILQHISRQLTTLADKFTDRTKIDISKITVSFIGHSLGGVVLYDFLTLQPELSFKPSAIFFMGSPLAMFLTIRDPFKELETAGESAIKLPLQPNCRLFNIFHPYDAIAYRLEPLVDLKMKKIEPSLVPYKGGHRVHVAIRKSVATVLSSIGEWFNSNNPAPVITIPGKTSTGSRLPTPTAISDPGSEEIKKLNFNERIDWILQESAVESVSEWVSAVGGHFTYWRHDDVYNFIIHQLISIEKIRNKGNDYFQ
jgi:hypothetical protein